MTSPTPISWDIETHLIKPGLTAPRMVCLSLADEGGGTALFEREQGLDIAERLIKKEFTVGHHVFFDLGVVAAERPKVLPSIFDALDEGRIHCTKIRQMMIDNCRGELKFIFNEETYEWQKQNYQLWRLIQRHKGYDIQKKKEGGGDIWRLRYSELDGVPIEKWPEAAAKYAIDDSIEARDIWHSQQDNDVAPDEIPGLTSQMQAAWALNLLGTWGLRTDLEAVESYERELEIEFAEHLGVCQEHGLRRAGVGKKGRSRDMKAIRAAVEDWYKTNDRSMKLTPTGQIATDREQLTDTDHPGLKAVAESVRVEKLLTTYVAALKRGTVVPLNPNYNTIIETFRTSCSGGMKIDGVPVGMQVQNLPRKGKVRECVIPRDENIFAFCDYDTLEMRTLAQICLDLFGHSELAEAAIAGQDFHLAFTADMLGMPYRQALDLYEAGDEEIANARQGNKISNYGMAGGMGWRTFIKYAKGFEVEISPEHAQKLHGGFRKKWPEMVKYFEHCSFLCREGNAEHIVFERSGLVRGDVTYTATANGFFQHLAAMGAKAALYAVVRECYCDAGSPLYGCRPWLFCHDEIGMEIPYEAVGPQGAHAAAMRLQEVMIEQMKIWCPDVPIGATAVMTRRWLKGAKPVYKDGILVPCRKEGKKWVYDGVL